VGDHARATSLTFHAAVDTFKLGRRKKAASKALLAEYRKIGSGASDLSEASDRRSYGSVKDQEQALADCQAALEGKQEAEAGLRRTLAERTELRTGEIEVLQSELKALTSVHDATAAAVKRCTKEAAALEKSIALPEEKRKDVPPVEKQRESLAAQKGELPGLTGAAETALAAKEAKTAEHRAERKAWKEELARREDEIRIAAKEVQRAGAEVSEAQIGLDGSLEDLGKSVYLAGLTTSDLEGPMGRAKAHLNKIEECQKAILERRIVTAANKDEAIRFTSIVGGAVLLVVIGLVVLVAAGNGGGATPTAGTHEPADQDSPDATAKVDPALADAVLALPPLASRERDGVTVFRPTGEVTVGERSAVKGGGSRLSVVAHAESRTTADGDFAPTTIHLKVTLDRDGKIVDWRPDGLADLETEELENLLGDWE
jgi:hypothetical protein